MKTASRNVTVPEGGQLIAQHNTSCCSRREAWAWCCDLFMMAIQGDATGLRLLPRAFLHFLKVVRR